MKVKYVVVSLLALLVVAIALLGPSVFAGQQRGKTVVKHATKLRGESTVKIKNDDGKNTQGHAKELPVAKGGKKTRASTSVVHFDNHTGWIIRCYVDGDYVGSMDGGGDLYVYVSSGTHTLYARALFDDGSELTWGPDDESVYGTFTYKLYSS